MTLPPIRIEILRRPDDRDVRDMLVELGLEDQESYDHPQETREEMAARTGSVPPSFAGENVVLVARDGIGRAIGLCWCVLFDPGNGLEAEVAELYVDPGERRRGVATALVGEAMRLFRERAATFVAVWTRPDNPAALAVYRHHGFRPTEQTVLTWLPLPGRDPADVDSGAEPSADADPRAEPPSDADPGAEHDADNHARDAPEEAMTLARDQVAHVATLARLGLSDKDLERYREQLEAILSHVDRLQQVDTSQVAETAQVGGLVNAWREDVRRECLPVEAALANAPRRRGDHFEVGAIQE